MNAARLASIALLASSVTAVAQAPYDEEDRVEITLQGLGFYDASFDADGDVAVLSGAYFGTFGQPSAIPGQAMVLERSAGQWSEVGLLEPASPGTRSAPTVTSAVSGDTIATAQGILGRVDLFARENGSWGFEQRIEPPLSGGFWGGFGRALALDGDTLVVGAPDTDIWIGSFLVRSIGSGHVYRRVAGTWTLEQSIVPVTADQNDRTGRSVALDGDTLILGAVDFDEFAPANGSAYVYTRSSSTWTLEQRLTPSDGVPANRFGLRVALDGDRALVGDLYGGVYLFERSGGTWAELQKLTVPGVSPFGFNYTVAIEGDVAVVSDKDSLTGGAAFVFEDTGSAWTRTQTLSPTHPGSDYRHFASATALSDGQLLAWTRAGTDAGSEDTVFTYTSDPGDYPSSCFGDAPSQTPGCAMCPCANSAPAESRGGCQNSSSRSARLRAMGAASATTDTLEFRLRDASSSTFALLFAGSRLLPQGNAACLPGAGVPSVLFLDGLRCVGSGASIVRLGVRATDAEGDGIANWGGGSALGGLIANGGFTAGETRHFQCFYRDDVLAGCGSGQNSTNAVTVLVTP